MTEKVQKIREKVEQLKSNLIHGACSSQVAMETRCKEEAYNEVLAILDTMQEEPASGLDNGDMPIERWKQAVEAASNQRNYRSSKGLTETRDDYFVDGVQWADEHPKEVPVSEDLEEVAEAWCHNDDNTGSCDYIGVTVCEYAFKAGANWQKKRDYIPLSDDINEVARQICNKVLNCEIDYKEGDVVLSDEEECVKAGIRWQMQKESIPSKDLEELINSLSKRYPEISFAKLSRIAVRVSRWQKQQDQSTIELAEDHAMLAGMEKMREEIMKDAVDGEIGYWNLRWLSVNADLPRTVAEGDKVKVILIKEK